MSAAEYDAVVLGAGAAGLMCAAVAGGRGRRTCRAGAGVRGGGGSSAGHHHFLALIQAGRGRYRLAARRIRRAQRAYGVLVGNDDGCVDRNRAGLGVEQQRKPHHRNAHQHHGAQQAVARPATHGFNAFLVASGGRVVLAGPAAGRGCRLRLRLAALAELEKCHEFLGQLPASGADWPACSRGTPCSRTPPTVKNDPKTTILSAGVAASVAACSAAMGLA